MTSLFPKIQHLKLGDLVMLGTHNSSMNNNKPNSIQKNFTNQHFSIHEQFDKGCRYFELRLNEFQKTYYGFHGLYLEPFVNITKQFDELAKRVGGNELIILDLERWLTLNLPEFFRKMKALFGDKIIHPKDVKEKFGTYQLSELTIENLTSLGNVILMIKCDYQYESSPFFLVREQIPGTRKFHRIRRIEQGQTDHLYTASEGEIEYLLDEHRTNYQDGAIGYIFESQEEGTVPLYRVFNESRNDHLYTVSESEKTHLVNAGWKNEEIAGYVYTQERDNTQLIHRFFSEKKHDHLYTPYREEI